MLETLASVLASVLWNPRESACESEWCIHVWTSSFVTALKQLSSEMSKFPFPSQNILTYVGCHQKTQLRPLTFLTPVTHVGGKRQLLAAEEASVVMCYLISSATDFGLFNFPFDFNIDLLKTTVIKTNCTGKLVFVCSCTSTYKAASIWNKWCYMGGQLLQ